MKCPVCGSAMPLSSDRCPDCGYHGPIRQPQAAAPASGIPYDPPNKTGRTKCCCCAAAVVIPMLVILIAMVVLSFRMLTQVLPMEEFGFEFEYSDETWPAFLPESMPEAADGDSFEIRNGVLRFLPQNWEGGRVLRVPETVDGQTVTAIAPGCFRDCTELTTILLPETVTEIGAGAFENCSALRGMPIPQTVKTIGADAFAGCIRMESLYIPVGVTSIAPGCFDDCAGLLYIFYEGTAEQWNDLYGEFINPFVVTLCQDGAYHQGARG